MKVYEEITKNIIKRLEEGVAPWVPEWNTKGIYAPPKNIISKKEYRGINFLILLIHQSYFGWGSPYWGTYKQFKELGGHVKKGEKGVRVIFFKMVEIEDKEKEEKKEIPMARSYVVFNEEQAEKLENINAEETKNIPSVEELIKKHNIDVRHGGGRAYFSGNGDEGYIRMPKKERYKNEEEYYATLLHEMVHWTNLEMKRKLSYAEEELVAELGSAFLCARLGINGMLKHAEYINEWVHVMKKDKKAIFRASKEAQKAVDYLLG